MSLILEALKKSEQQRRLGEAPTLASPVVATRRRRSLLPVLAVLIVIAGAAGWWLTRPTYEPPAATPPPPADNTAASTQKPAPAKPASPVPAKTDQTDARMKQRAANLAALADADAKRRAAEAQRPASAKPPAGAASVPADLSKPGGRAPLATATPTPGTAPGTAPGKPGAAATTPAKPAAATPAPPATAPPAQTAAVTKPATAPATPSLPTIWELPYSTRKDLPAIELSMHVYSPDPKQRFVVVKGDRHVEGEEIGENLVLREIRQDGLVLEYKGQRFVYPRSGR